MVIEEEISLALLNSFIGSFSVRKMSLLTFEDSKTFCPKAEVDECCFYLDFRFVFC